MDPALLGLAANPALPAHLLDRLVAAADGELDDELARRQDLTRTQIRALAARSGAATRLAHEGLLRAEDIDPAAQPLAALALLDAGAGPPQWARRLAGDPCVGHREKLAGCPGLPADVVRRLTDDPDVGVVAELALGAPADVAARLAAHPHADVRRAVAANPATPPQTLAALLTGEGLPPLAACRVCDQEQVPFVHAPDCARRGCSLLPGDACDGTHESAAHEILLQALGNPATPTTPMSRFADHPSVLVRACVAAREGLPRRVYATLATDALPMVRAALAANPSIDEALIRSLAQDPGHDVRRSLAHHPGVPLDVLARLARAVRTGPVLLPRVASASLTEVAGLAAAQDPALRALVALRRDLPEPVRDALARDPDAKVLAAIAPHPGLSEAQLLDMVGRHAARVAAGVARNPDASAAVLEALTLGPAPVRRALREVARHPNASVAALMVCLADTRARPLAAVRPELPADVVGSLTADGDPRVAEAAAANPSLPADAMALLLP